MTTPGQRLVKTCFLIIAGLAAISCIVRPDYNLPLFAFLWWRFFSIPEDRGKRQRILLLLFVVLTCIQDVVFLLYWPGKWLNEDWISVYDTMQTWHIATIVIGWIELVLKAVLLGFILISRDHFCLVLKSDEFEELEVTTYHQNPPPTRVYASID